MTDMSYKRVLILSLLSLGAATRVERDSGVHMMPILYGGESAVIPMSVSPLQYYPIASGLVEGGAGYASGGPGGVGYASGVAGGVGYASGGAGGVGYASGGAGGVGYASGGTGGAGMGFVNRRLSGGFAKGSDGASNGGFTNENKEIGGGEFSALGRFSKKGQAGANSGYHNTDSYIDDNHHIGDKVAHGGYYSDVTEGRKAQQDGGLYEKGQAFDRGSKLNFEEGSNNGFKKGHHSNGFHSSYHKDESGHDTKFYDDDHDEGHHARAQDLGDFYGARGLSAAQGHGGAGGFSAGSKGSQEQFGSGRLEGARSGLRDAQGHRGYYGQEGDFGQEAEQSVRSGGRGGFGSGLSYQGGGTRSMGFLN